MMLREEHCSPKPPAIDPADAHTLLEETPAWRIDGAALVRTFTFENFYQTMAFANVVAYLANREDHHPDMALTYKRCEVSLTTHTAGGLSRNDFILAARIDAIPA